MMNGMTTFVVKVARQVHVFQFIFSLTILYDLKWLVCIAFLSINHKHLSGGTPKSKSLIPIIYLLLAN
jgi:hypothetical protein